MKQLLREIQQEHLKDPESIPDFRVGDSVRVSVRLVDEIKTKGDKEARIQAFEGTCIARGRGGIDETFTVRRVTGQVAVERKFLVNSPIVDGIEVTRRGRVRRSKLYYLRGRVGKRARVQAARHAR